MPTIRTLLSGGELFGVGARQAGYTHIDGYEIDPKIAAVARLNGFDVRAADICAVDYESLPVADHLHASPVCTRASTANVGATESDLDIAMADAVCRAIAAHQGRTVTIENVWAYREFKSFQKISTQLSISGFVYDFRHLNSADYGVPQTRKRLILRAVRGVDRVPGLRPTHSKRGGILLERWNGWYAAIEDLIPMLPETQPAPWQLARMPEALRESMLVAQGAYGERLVTADPQSPAFTITANSNQSQLRAFLMGNNQQEWGDGVVYDDEPCFSVTTQSHGRARAFLVASNSGPYSWGDNTRTDDEPAHTVTLNADGRTRAYIVSDKNARSEERGGMSCREGNEPIWTIDTSVKGSARAYTAGRWVRMDIRALGRFQTVPDDYIGLTPAINGNGVPSLLARRIMESLRGVAQ